MKIFLLCLACLVAGFFGRDLIRVADAAPKKTVTFQVPVPVPISAMADTAVAKPTQKPAPKKVTAARGETGLDRQLRETGVEVSNSGYWRYNPVSRYDENHPGGAWASPFHGEPRDL